MILGIVKFIEQFTKGKYFHDFNVYLNAIKVLDNFSNPYSNIIELPYLYPPIISKLLETSNQSILASIYELSNRTVFVKLSIEQSALIEVKKEFLTFSKSITL